MHSSTSIDLRVHFYFMVVYQSHIDDEYAAAGFTDPKICITTSRAPSSKLKQFAKVRHERRALDFRRQTDCIPPDLLTRNPL